MITDFVKIADVPENIIREYESRLPSAFINFWKTYGFGTFYHGFLKSINPHDYQELLEQSYFQGNVSIPVFATAFGDLITWEKNRFVGIVKYRYGDNEVISAGTDYFFEDLENGEYDDDEFSSRQYGKAVEKLGIPEYDECFGYVPLLALGGKESVNNIKRVKIREHISLIVQLCGGV